MHGQSQQRVLLSVRVVILLLIAFRSLPCGAQTATTNTDDNNSYTFANESLPQFPGYVMDGNIINSTSGSHEIHHPGQNSNMSGGGGGFTANVLPTRQTTLEPARVSCNAAYSTACARTNAQWLATNVGKNLTELMLFNNTPPEQLWNDIANEDYNMPTGFYPFVLDRRTTVCVAHGGDHSLVGFPLQTVLQMQGNGFSNGTDLIHRFIAAADQGGGWVQYLWRDNGRAHTKLAFVVDVTGHDSDYVLGVGYSTEPLPPDVPCSADQDGWCSITNTLSLVGKAQLRLYQSATRAQFETALYELSYNKEEYQIPTGFYVFMYDYNGLLKAHGLIHDHFDKPGADLFPIFDLGTREEGEQLIQNMIQAAEGSGWLQYQWRNGQADTSFTKVAFVVKIVFQGENYFMGVGFKFQRDATAEVKDCSSRYNLPCSFRTALQLSSHELCHAISSPLPINEMWHEISYSANFRQGDFYAYAFDFNGTCVAHGYSPHFVGMTISEIVENVGVQSLIEPDSVNDLFVETARAGGGWLWYHWGTPNRANDTLGVRFEKVAYVFQMTLNGRNFYGGAGFSNVRAPIAIHIANGTKKNGQPIMCSPDYNLACSETNCRAILGQSLTDLALVSSDAQNSRGEYVGRSMADVLQSITNQNSAYRVNGFYVAVFSVDGSECALNDGSGCCIAHGHDASLVHKTWQQILDSYKITSIAGDDLHRDLVSESNKIGGELDYPWSQESGSAQTKRAFTAGYKNGKKAYYIVTEYFKTPLPPTCDNCPPNLQCTRDYQDYCKPIPPQVKGPLAWIIAILCLVAVSLVLVYWVRHRNWVKRQILDSKIKAMEDEIKGMVEICQDTGVQIPTAKKYFEKFGMTGDSARGSSARRKVDVFWYWEEDLALLNNHDRGSIFPGTTFVRYADEISVQLEDAYQLCLQGEGYYEISLDLQNVGNKNRSMPTGLRFLIDFEEMAQINPVTDQRRRIRREEIPIQLDEELANILPPLPGDIDFFGDDGEDFLPTFKGQVIQVSKEHPTQPWIYGSVLYDPLLDAAQEQPQSAAGLNQILSNALHDRPTSGWFPKVLAVAADVKVMQNLLVTLGGEGVKNLKPPDAWDSDKDGIIPVVEGSAEYQEVVHHFLAALYDERDYVTVLGVERIQSMPLWQSYAVKKQTMKTRDNRNPAGLVNNRDLNGLERIWLFHGTRSEAIPQIVKQGFNRAFAGRNAVVFGKGVYFARDASYSSHRAYSQPDNEGIQRLFMCRVAVGDWCQGAEGMLTPAAKPNNNLELFDTTVDDVSDPSVFVVYHDSQAYPDYLISFKRND